MDGSVGVIWNPTSGRGLGARQWPRILASLTNTFGDRNLIVEATTGPSSARQQAQRMALDGVRMVVAAGGDGTVSEVMQGLLGSESSLGVLPIGTGNDFSRTLGFGTDIDSAIQALKNGNNQLVDIGKWAQGSESGHFLNVAGCGFDAVVADKINNGFRRLRGTSAYMAAVLQSLVSYKATELSIEVDGREIKGRAMLCALANAQCYGGGMRIAPTAEISDGLLDLVMVGEMGTIEFLSNFGKVFRGTHLSHQKVSHRQFQKLTISSDPPVPFLVDGELRPAGPVSVEVVPAAIRVVVP